MPPGPPGLPGPRSFSVTTLQSRGYWIPPHLNQYDDLKTLSATKHILLKGNRYDN